MSLLGKFRKNTFLQLSFDFGDVVLGNVDKSSLTDRTPDQSFAGCRKKGKEKLRKTQNKHIILGTNITYLNSKYTLDII